jgi:hypothetical protein
MALEVHDIQTLKIHSDKLGLDFTVHVQGQLVASQQKCYIMTVHDIGCDCKLTLTV